MEEKIEDKKLFLGLLVLALGLLGSIVSGVWYLNLSGLNSISRIVLLALGTVITLFVVVVTLGVIGIIIILQKREPIKFFYLPIRIVIAYLFPLIIYLGKLLGFDQLKIKNSFIQVNNQLVNPKRI
ncbi:MAG: DUF116 domain-containing protein, partial [Bacillota bacterium]